VVPLHNSRLSTPRSTRRSLAPDTGEPSERRVTSATPESLSSAAEMPRSVISTSFDTPARSVHPYVLYWLDRAMNQAWFFDGAIILPRSIVIWSRFTSDARVVIVSS
jgi:hypothetical protein